jgi:signal transduction histidine kinase
MDRTQKIDEQLRSLATYLESKRAAVLEAWRKAVQADPELSSPTSLPRTQFNDHIPQLLESFEKRLRTWPNREKSKTKEQRKDDAAGHGLQRWQQGYDLREVSREWSHLQRCLADELDRFVAEHHNLELEVTPIAWRALAEICSQGVSESTTQYFRLQQAEAVGHLRDLESTLDQARMLEASRSELFRQAAHDIRGNVGVVKNVATGLSFEGLTEERRVEFLRLLQRSVSSLQSMMDEVMDLARLQAGRELLQVRPFDAAALLRDICEHLQPAAAEKGLYLKTEGPDMLPVEGDDQKVRRVTQNLLLNAIKYTSEGGVTVHWGDSRDNDPKRWMLWVRDTGPGFHAGPGAPVLKALKDATADVHVAEHKAGSSGPATDPPGALAAEPADERPIHQERGEGIGLSIVKRLCELLDASIELDTKPEKGTTFRVVLPRQYEKN